MGRGEHLRHGCITRPIHRIGGLTLFAQSKRVTSRSKMKRGNKRTHRGHPKYSVPEERPFLKHSTASAPQSLGSTRELVRVTFLGPYNLRMNTEMGDKSGGAYSKPEPCVSSKSGAPFPVTGVGSGRSSRRGERSVSWPKNKALRWVAWLLSAFFAVIAVLFALRWKSGEAWENFLQDFATSPAAAGCAAVLAAVIAARSFGRGLEHTQSEARLDRIKEREDSWWEKFEWVTDRIIPKDPKAEKLALPLALTLLLSLTEMATGKFQRDAAEGIKQHYLETAPTERDSKRPLERDLKAELESLRSFRNATTHSNGVQGAVSAQIYDREVSQALIDAWEPQAVKLELTPIIMAGDRMHVPDAVLEVAERRVLIEFKAWRAVSTNLLRQTFEKLTRHLNDGEFSDLVIITPVTLTANVAASARDLFPKMRLVEWKPEDGPAVLRGKLEDALSLPGGDAKK